MALFGLALVTAACGGGAPKTLTFASQAAAVGSVQTVIVSTARAGVEGLPLYTGQRSERLHFARFQVSVPPDRALGAISYPKRDAPPDPATDFLVVEAQRLRGEAGFVAAIDAALAADPRGRGDAFLFAHGFDVNFAEGLYRQAQIQHDFGRHGASVHFSWPSAGKSDGYLYDGDSALFSRDALEATIAALGRSESREVILAAHSMGAFLMMETLLAMARADGAADFAKIAAVVLISPDIEVDVFRRQAPPVLARGLPIYLLVSRTDRALALSARARGERDRLGSIRSKAELGGLDVEVIDLSDVRSTDLSGHFKEASSPALIDFVRGLQGSGIDAFTKDRRSALAETGAALIQRGADILVAPLTGP